MRLCFSFSFSFLINHFLDVQNCSFVEKVLSIYIVYQNQDVFQMNPIIIVEQQLRYEILYLFAKKKKKNIYIYIYIGFVLLTNVFNNKDHAHYSILALI